MLRRVGGAREQISAGVALEVANMLTPGVEQRELCLLRVERPQTLALQRVNEGTESGANLDTSSAFTLKAPTL